MNPIVTLFVIFILIILIGFFWYYTRYVLVAVNVNSNNKDLIDQRLEKLKSENQSSENKSNDLKESRYSVTIISNLHEGELKSRAINLITKGGKYYIYLPKDSNFASEIEIDSKATLCTYIYTKDLQLQINLVGEFTLIKSFEKLNIYELIVKHKKISKTSKVKDNEITSTTYDNKEIGKQVVSLSSLKDVLLFINSKIKDDEIKDNEMKD